MVAIATPSRTSPVPVRAYAILFASIFAFGFSAIFARWAESPGLVVAAWRTALATLLLFGPYLRQPPAKRHIDRSTLRWGVVGGTLFAASLGTFHIALETTTAANATFLDNIAPLWVGLITLRRKVPRQFWPGVGVALVGAALIIFGEGGWSNLNRGDTIVIGESIIWATYLVVAGEIRGRTTTLNWVIIVLPVSAVWLTLFSVLSDYALWGYNTETIIAMLGAGVISQAGGFVGLHYALAYIPTARVSVAAMLQPVITAVAGYLLLQETFTGWRLVGGGLVLIGVYLVTVPGHARPFRRQLNGG